MAEIELVIRIPEGLKKDFEAEQWTALSCMEMKDALMNGTQLTKGHGRLIDADRLLRPDMIRMCYHMKNGYTAMPIIDIEHAETVIPADKEMKNDKRKTKKDR